MSPGNNTPPESNKDISSCNEQAFQQFDNTTKNLVHNTLSEQSRLVKWLRKKIKSVTICHGEETIYAMQKYNQNGKFCVIAPNHLEAKGAIAKLGAPMDHLAINTLLKPYGISSLPLAKANPFTEYKPGWQKNQYITQIEDYLITKTLYNNLYPALPVYRNTSSPIVAYKKKGQDWVMKIKHETSVEQKKINTRKNLAALAFQNNTELANDGLPANNMLIYPYGYSYPNLQQDFSSEPIQNAMNLKPSFASSRMFGDRPIVPVYIAEGKQGHFYTMRGDIIQKTISTEENGEQIVKNKPYTVIKQEYEASMQLLKDAMIVYLQEHNLINDVLSKQPKRQPHTSKKPQIPAPDLIAPQTKRESLLQSKKDLIAKIMIRCFKKYVESFVASSHCVEGEDILKEIIQNNGLGKQYIFCSNHLLSPNAIGRFGIATDLIAIRKLSNKMGGNCIPLMKANFFSYGKAKKNSGKYESSNTEKILESDIIETIIHKLYNGISAHLKNPGFSAQQNQYNSRKTLKNLSLGAQIPDNIVVFPGSSRYSPFEETFRDRVEPLETTVFKQRMLPDREIVPIYVYEGHKKDFLIRIGKPINKKQGEAKVIEQYLATMEELKQKAMIHIHENSLVNNI